MLRYFLLTLFIMVNNSYGFEFVSRDVYFNERPRQVALMDLFDRVVNRSAEPLQFSQLNTVNIAVILPANKNRESLLSAFKKRMKSLKIDYRLDVIEYNLNINNDALFERYQKAMRFPPDFLITTLERFQQKAIVESILRRNQTKVILYDVSTPVKGWENNGSVFYTGVDYMASKSVLIDFISDVSLSKSELIAIAFSNGYKNHQFCNAYLDLFSENDLNIVDIIYFDESEVSKTDLMDRLLSKEENVFIFQCDNFLAPLFIDSLNAQGVHASIINRWSLTEADASSSALLEFQPPFEKIEIAIAEMIKHHLESKQYPNVYKVDLIINPIQDSRTMMIPIY